MLFKKFSKKQIEQINAPDDENTKLIEEIQKVKEQLESANTMFNFTTDPKLTESAIHEINSCQLRYDFLVREAKIKGLVRH